MTSFVNTSPTSRQITTPHRHAVADLLADAIATGTEASLFFALRDGIKKLADRAFDQTENLRKFYRQHAHELTEPERKRFGEFQAYSARQGMLTDTQAFIVNNISRRIIGADIV